MGRSLCAKLFYGFPLLETFAESNEYDEELSEFDEYEWEGGLLQGIHPKPLVEGYKGPEWDEWRRGLKLAKASIPLCIEMVGWEDYTYKVLAVRRSLVIAEGYDALSVSLSEVNPEWDNLLHDWCKSNGFKYREPSWQLAALYW